MRFERGAISLRRTAAEILDKETRHALVFLVSLVRRRQDK